MILVLWIVIILEPQKVELQFKIKDISDGICSENKFITTMDNKKYMESLKIN